jgi:hypothetical protein
MGTQPQKTQDPQKKIFHYGFCRALFADHFGRKNFPIASLFYEL